jgi:hypothetical protein
MRLSTLVGFLGVQSVAKAGTLVYLQSRCQILRCATGKAFYNGMAKVSQVAAVYGPIVAD